MSTSLLGRGVGVVVGLINVPLAVRYLGNEGYGLLIVIISVVGWIQFSNLGLGLGLQNTLTEQTALGNKQAQRELVSTTFFVLLAIGLLLAAVASLTFSRVNWLSLFPATTDRFIAAVPRAVALTLGCFILALTCSFVQPIYAARQELHIYGLQGLIANVVSLLALIAAVRYDAGLLGVAAANIGVIALFAGGFALWTVFGRNIPEIRPSFSHVRMWAAKSVFRTGAGFLILHLCAIVATQSDAFLIAQFLTTDQVTPYSVAQRVFAQLVGLLAIVTIPLWPAFGNAKALGDVAWIRAIYRKVNMSFLVFYGAAFVVLTVVGHSLIVLWVGRKSAPSELLICALGVYYFIIQWSSNHSLMLNGLGVIRKQMYAVVAQTALALLLNILLVRRLGPIGLAIGGGLAYLSISAWYLPYLFRSTLARIGNDASRTEVPVQPTTATG